MNEGTKDALKIFAITIVTTWVALATYDLYVAPYIGGAFGKTAADAKEAKENAAVAKTESIKAAAKT